jgi:titin
LFANLNSGTLTLTGNFIGTDKNGTGPIGNSQGVTLQNLTGTIGGTTTQAANVISGNGNAMVYAIGLYLNGGNLALTIQGNRIGTNLSGTAAIPNSGDGLRILNSNGNTVGGTSAAAANVISGNGAFGNLASGIRITGSSVGNTVTGNLIGVAADATTALANTEDGVYVDTTSASTTIGGSAAGAGNVIASNTRNGIGVANGLGVALRGNSIFSNGLLGIDLGRNGVTTNDSAGHSGPNNYQNFPVINAATPGTATTVTGTLSSAANTTFTLEFFASASCDPSTYGEGQRPLGTAPATTNGAGSASFNAAVGPAAAGEYITATATDPSGNTSEFAGCVVAE